MLTEALMPQRLEPIFRRYREVAKQPGAHAIDAKLKPVFCFDRGEASYVRMG